MDKVLIENDVETPTIADIILEALEDAGYNLPEEVIPGLMVAARELASRTGVADQALDEAVRMLE